ncbi:2-dehydropantoate 2-reductase [Ideonella margarita]|uniref:2-dehydropantoate 2-reductase n=1 Tax=Ideonella margarita TaxID=2984191 RepID=A0ABU9C585_9BURK
MKICIYGAGAIGGFIGARLASLGAHEVSAVARGDTLLALQARGFNLQDAQGRVLVDATPVRAVADPAELGPQDLVVVAVKGPAMGAVAANIAPLLGPHTIVLPAMNGVPWWFLQGLPGVGDLGKAPLESVDPGGRIAAAIALSHVVGCVVHASTFTVVPGVVGHKMGQGLIIGEAFGEVSPRVEAVAEVLRSAGFDVTASPHLRQDLWYKLWGNLTMNPVSALTGANIEQIHADPLLLGFCSAAMREAQAIGERIGCPINQTPEDRHQVTAKLGAFKTSMLQDVEAGRALELDAIVTAVREIGLRVGVATPTIDGLLGLSRVFARQRGLYPLAN